jgi:hypothetical protein
MEGDVYLTIPETDKYISIQVVDENHETQPMIYGPGKHKLTAKTKYAFIAVRSLDDEARKNLEAEANSSDDFIVKEWDEESFGKVADSGNKILPMDMINRKHLAIKKAVKPLAGTMLVQLGDGEAKWLWTIFIRQVNT